ncbi:hypothetical protein DV738_g3051, partial [Chaetothyriales sp. CBS 135597]
MTTTTFPIPPDYLEKAYAAVLGKLIGVYLGRPFEGWTYQRILKELGPIRYYDGLRSQTTTTTPISAEEIGQSWLNNTVEGKSIFWWGGRGISTEHTAYLNLKHGIKAPLSGSIQTNGKTVAEQIGAQIFIDGWAIVAPGNPALAARLAQAAGSVSHDGVAVHAATLWAAMEAEAFVSSDVDHLLDVGLSFIPADSLISNLVSDIRRWAKIDGDWEKTRQRIEDVYGYDKFLGVCHVMPNHGIMISALIYGGHDFHQAMHIINTSGWDTDCNSGNIGCLVAIMHGLAAFDGGPDWRGPLADRALISSADVGYSLNNAARITYDLVNLGRQLAGEAPLPPPKDGAQFHFSLPGSVQGFIASHNSLLPDLVQVRQSVDDQGRSGLGILINGLTNSVEPIEVLTQTFTPPDIVEMRRTYDFMAAPLVCPGQKVTALLRADKSNNAAVLVNLRLKHYNINDSLSPLDGPSVLLAPGQEEALNWTIPNILDSQPIQQLGIALTGVDGILKGAVHLDSLSYVGTPQTSLRHPIARPADRAAQAHNFWARVWTHNLSTFRIKPAQMSFILAQDQGEGIMLTGTKEWLDYKITVPRFMIKLGSAGLAVRVRGLRRYYTLLFKPDRQTVALVKVKDDTRTELASAKYEWELDEVHPVTLVAEGARITAIIAGDQVLEAEDHEYASGGFGIIVMDGSVAIDQFDIGPCQ